MARTEPTVVLHDPIWHVRFVVSTNRRLIESVETARGTVKADGSAPFPLVASSLTFEKQ